MRKMRQRILIYGDSNVWGARFGGSRVPHSRRWANQVRRMLRGRADITTNGVCGRVAGSFRTDKPHKNGHDYFVECLHAALPVGLVIIALGTNDLQQRFHRTADDIIADLTWYAECASGVRVVYILPPPFAVDDTSGPEFTSESLAVQQQLITRRAELGDTIVLGRLPLSDGLHFSPRGHDRVAKIVRNYIRKKL